MPSQESVPQERREEQVRRLDTLFREHERALYRYVRYLSDSPSMAKDIYQETWLRVAQHIARGGRIKNFKSFLFTTAVNLFRDELRKLKIRRFFLGSEGEQANIIWKIADDEKAPSFEMRDALAAAIRELSPKQRMMFTLAYIEGFKIHDISEIMGCAEGTVKATIYKAVQKLRKELKDFNTA